MAAPRFRIIGPGRAGGSLQVALVRAGWEPTPALGRGQDLSGAARGVEFLIIAVPDQVISAVAEAVEPVPSTTVVHLSGAAGPDQLLPHTRRVAAHPLASLTGGELGAQRLRGCWFGVTTAPPSLPQARHLVEAVGGRFLAVSPADRGLYHAAACVASNHLVVLLAQVERLAAAVGAPTEALLDLSSGTLENVRALGATAALTGPASRGDWSTIQAHRRALPPEERPLYDLLADGAARLAGRALTPELAGPDAEP